MSRIVQRRLSASINGAAVYVVLRIRHYPGLEDAVSWARAKLDEFGNAFRYQLIASAANWSSKSSSHIPTRAGILERLDGDDPARVVYRARLLDRRPLHGERQRHSGINGARPVELTQPAHVAVVEAIAGSGEHLL